LYIEAEEGMTHNAVAQRVGLSRPTCEKGHTLSDENRVQTVDIVS
jgi:DNA-binding XRE family transcriptional regulator